VREFASLDGDVTLADGVTVGPGARLLGAVRVGRDARIGANATVLGDAEVGRGAVVEPGSVVDSDVPAHAVVRGQPARIVGYVDTLPMPSESDLLEPTALDAPSATAVSGVVLHPLTRGRDLRGNLAALEFADMPFVPRRVFTVYGVPNESVRGAHAHRACGQLLVCVSGEVSSVADDGRSRQEFRLTSPDVGVYIPPMVWSMQYRYTRDAVLVVLAELPYDPDDYIRDYEEFLELVAAR
jgi:UDP-2-acetamido-3-amino-2,3-dideoxy-glucuronate N-acetyltransferase